VLTDSPQTHNMHLHVREEPRKGAVQRDAPTGAADEELVAVRASVCLAMRRKTQYRPHNHSAVVCWLRAASRSNDLYRQRVTKGGHQRQAQFAAVGSQTSATSPNHVSLARTSIIERTRDACLVYTTTRSANFLHGMSTPEREIARWVSGNQRVRNDVRWRPLVAVATTVTPTPAIHPKLLTQCAILQRNEIHESKT
jgi:hypothetical protein